MNDDGPDVNGLPNDQGHDRPERAEPEVAAEVELAIVAGVFHAAQGSDEALAYALARYVVLSRMEAGCRNIDLVTSLTVPGMFMVWEKWESHEHRRAHFEGAAAAQLAQEISGLVSEAPQFDAFEAITAHDLV